QDRLSCASCSASSVGNSTIGGLVGTFSNHFGRGVLNDGTFFIDTPNRLVLDDTNGVEDVYAWKDGVATLVSTGTNPKPSNFADATADGSSVFLRTSQQLVPQDNDKSVDLYDAVVDGGIASQYPPPAPASCKGEA